jgi:hypothetical protein
LEKVSKEVVMTESIYYPGIPLKGLRKTTKSLVGYSDVQAEVIIESLPTRSIENYRSTNLPGRKLLILNRNDKTIPPPPKVTYSNFIISYIFTESQESLYIFVHSYC